MKFKILAMCALLVIGFWFWIIPVKGQECPTTDYQCQIDTLQREYDALAPAQEKNKEDLAELNKQIADLNSRILKLTNQLKSVEAEIEEREEDLAFTREIFGEKARNHYTFLRLYDPITPFLFSDSASEAFREISFRQKAADEDRKAVETYGQDLISLKNDRDNLEKNKVSLSSLQVRVKEKQKFLASEVAKVDAYLGSLTARQNELAALKAGGFSTTVGDVPASLEPCSGKPGSSNFCDPGFRPAFAGFSYGAPHRKGMSQYGAYGRAKSGQSAEAILSAYYGGIQLKKDYSTNINITVSGYGTVDIETYVKRIYEMPGSWTANDSAALKAQAVAARSYALAYTNNGAKSICATESCQVYKPANKGGAWDAAVDATRGWVLVSGGAPFSAWYASTAGGYTFGYSSQGHTSPNLWDTPGGQGGWPNSAYEIVGGSPWFYKGWYKSRSGASCGRSNPWLTSEEMADILNAWSVLYEGGGDVSRVSPVGSCWSGNPYSISELRNIGGFTSVSSSNQAIYGQDGSTVSVTFQTNKGTKTISGDQLKKAFNLRAPGYIGLKSSLFNIEKL
ncbi:MAG TPA: SpoIID/LytB domain-containing protein [Patescibacteria group bacterium]|nr:SpoIID/LytB domain-containing protein [Patescibacteria group bacterium]